MPLQSSKKLSSVFTGADPRQTAIPMFTENRIGKNCDALIPNLIERRKQCISH